VKNRILFSFFALSFLFAIAASKAFYLQVLNKEKLIKYAKSQFIREVKEYPNRGNILDRNGHPLAINVHVFNIFTIPKNKDRAFYDNLLALSKIVPELPYSKLKKTVEKRTRYTWLARKIALNETQVKEIKKLEGIFVEEHTQRVYPNRELMAQTLGFVGLDNTGLAGVENSFNKVLKGEPQIVKYIKDAKGRPIKFETKAPAVRAEDIHLSIDKDIQGALESYLKDAVIHHKANRGGAGVMDVETGEIIAVANYPTYDPNQLKSSTEENRKLSFITDPFEPGSIFKALTIASALEHKAARPDTKYFCEYGRLKVQNHWIREADHSDKLEWLSVEDILKFSSNVGTTKIAFDLKFPKLWQTLQKFEINERTGIELRGESKGLLSFNPKSDIQPLTLSNLSFGHGVATTGLQMLRSFAVFANGGYLVKPTILKNEESQLLPENRILSQETADEIVKILSGAVSEGTGKNARIPHYVIAGKTGTAQRVSSKGYDGYVSSFIGFPVNVNKRFVVLVYIDNPTANGYYGGRVSAPVFKKITQYILYKKKDFAKFAQYNEKSNKTNLDEVKIKQSSTNRSYARNVVPSFVGLDKASAMALAEKRGIQLEMTGFGVVKRQSIAAGEPLVSGAELKLQFEVPTYAE